MDRLRRTKIVATLGPATDDPAVLEQLLASGVDVVRLNFSHGTTEEQKSRYHAVRECSAKLGKEVGVLVDLQGPKIRITDFIQGEVYLTGGQPFTIDVNCPEDQGSSERVGVTYKGLVSDVASGDVLLLDDGRLELEVESVAEGKIVCRVKTGGRLSGHKGVNLQGGGLSSGALTEKDFQDMETAIELGADYIAVSFVRRASDVQQARSYLFSKGWRGGLVAKIERAEALEVIEEVIMASDAVMIARGDLGVEIGDARLPAVQKQIIRQTRKMNRVAITATQMMESMLDSPLPTRADVFDVANAVLDGTDAVMLSAETAVGKYPLETVKAMRRVCIEAEKQDVARKSRHRIDTRFTLIDEAIAMSTMYAANHLGVKAIAALTESGATALWMSRISSGIPIFALSDHSRTRRKMTLYRGVYPARSKGELDSAAAQHDAAVRVLIERQVVQSGDLMITTCGDQAGLPGGTNSLRIVRAGISEKPKS